MGPQFDDLEQKLGAMQVTLLRVLAAACGSEHGDFYQKCIEPLANGDSIKLAQIPADAIRTLMVFLAARLNESEGPSRSDGLPPVPANAFQAVLNQMCALNLFQSTGQDRLDSLFFEPRSSNLPGQLPHGWRNRGEICARADCAPPPLPPAARTREQVNSLLGLLQRPETARPLTPDGMLPAAVCVNYGNLDFTRWHWSKQEVIGTLIFAASVLSPVLTSVPPVWGIVTAALSAWYLGARMHNWDSGAVGLLKSFFQRPDPRSVQNPLLQNLLKECEELDIEPVCWFERGKMTIAVRIGE